MIVTHIVLKNWRNFRAIDVNLGNRVFLVGPNASGKSNFLDVFKFLHDIAKPGGGLQKAISDRGGISKIRCLAAREDPDIEIEVHLAEVAEQKPLYTYAIGIKQQARGRHLPYLGFEKVWKETEIILDRPSGTDKKDSLLLTHTHLEQINANKKFREIERFFETISYSHLVPQLLRNPTAFRGPGAEGDPFGRNFLETVAKTPERTRISRLRKIEAALKIAVPQLFNLTETRDEAGIPHLEATYQHWRAKGAKQREDQFSDGTLRLLGLLWSLLENDSLLLLEEPELSLNSAIVGKLPSLFYRLQTQKKRQVILSTHSVDLLTDAGIGGEEVLLLTPSSQGTKVEIASSIQDIRLLMEGGMSVGDAVLPRTNPQNIDLIQMELFK
jgi:predicted ATPase